MQNDNIPLYPNSVFFCRKRGVDVESGTIAHRVHQIQQHNPNHKVHLKM